MNNTTTIPGIPPGMSTRSWAARQRWARENPEKAIVRELIEAKHRGSNPCEDCGAEQTNLYVVSYWTNPPEYHYRCRDCSGRERAAYQERTRTKTRSVTA